MGKSEKVEKIAEELENLIEEKDEDEDEVKSSDDEKKENPFKKKEKDEKSSDDDDDTEDKKLSEEKDEDEEDDEDESMDDEETKKKVEEHLSAIFSDSEGLSENFKSKVITIFEAAVKDTARKVIEVSKMKNQKLYEEKEVSLAKSYELKTEEFEKSFNEKSSKYLEYVIEQWKEENAIPLQENLLTQQTNSFMEGLKKLFVEHYIEIPDGKVDVLESLTTSIEEVEEKNERLIKENYELKETIKEGKKERVLDELSENLSSDEKEKFAMLTENISFGEDFKEKALAVKEAYFSESNDSFEKDEDIEIVFEEKKKNISEKYQDNEVALAAKYLSKLK